MNKPQINEFILAFGNADDLKSPFCLVDDLLGAMDIPHLILHLFDKLGVRRAVDDLPFFEDNCLLRDKFDIGHDMRGDDDDSLERDGGDVISHRNANMESAFFISKQ